MARWHATAPGWRAVVVSVKRDRGRRPNSPAGWCRLRRPPAPAADEPGHSFALDLAASRRVGTTGGPRGDLSGQYRRGSTPGTPTLSSGDRLGGWPGQLLLVGHPLGQAAVQDADQRVAQCAQRLMVAGTTGAVGVVAAACAGRGGQRGER